MRSQSKLKLVERVRILTDAARYTQPELLSNLFPGNRGSRITPYMYRVSWRSPSYRISIIKAIWLSFSPTSSQQASQSEPLSLNALVTS